MALLFNHFSLQYLNLHFQRLKFVHLALQESAGDVNLFRNILGLKKVKVLELNFTLLKNRYFHKAFVEQPVQGIFQPAKDGCPIVFNLPCSTR